jgi:hypothetical protein
MIESLPLHPRLYHSLRLVGDGFRRDECFFQFKNRLTGRTSQWAELVIDMVLHQVQLGYLDVTVQEKLRSGWPGPFVKVEGCFN